MRKLNIGFFSVGLDTYWPQFDGLLDRLMGCHQQIIQHLQEEAASVIDAGMVDRSDRCQTAIQEFKKGGIDLLIVNISTYGLSKLVLPVVREMNTPTLVLCLQPSEAMDYDRINALGDRGKMTGEWLAYCQACVAPELGGVFAKSGIPYRLVTGHLEEAIVWKEIKQWLTAARVVKALKRTKVGVMGHYYDGMLDVYSDLSRFTGVLGTEFVITEFGELKYYIDRCREDAINQKIREFGDSFDVSEDCTEYEMERAAKTSLGLDKLVDQYDLGAFAYFFEGRGDPAYENVITSVIPGFTLLTARHIPVAGEYEIKNVHAMKIMDLLGAGGSFSEFYGLDFNEGIILLGHDGPAHFAIADGKVGLVPVPVYHGKPGKGLSIQMSVRNGPVTLLSICETRGGDLKLLCAEGESVSGTTLQIGNTNSRYRFSLGPREFTNAWSREGPSHHMAIGVGHRASTLAKVADLLGFSFVEIC